MLVLEFGGKKYVHIIRFLLDENGAVAMKTSVYFITKERKLLKYEAI